jgi:hypothetical protein
MDRPKINVRRHNSLPATRGSLLLRMSNKSNPYVGTFRHSPPSSFFLTKEILRERTNALFCSLKNSPFVGTLRHAPPVCSFLQTEVYRFLIEQAAMKPSKINGLNNLREIISGHLRGGGPDHLDMRILHRTLQEPLHNASGTFKVLSRLLYWVLFPSESNTATKEIDEAASVLTDSYDTDEDDNCSDRSDDEEEEFRGDRSDYRSMSISSQAEAYYAHEATKDLMANDLDYTITQMDVLRMMRNASRHLDVESILQLPVYTYYKEELQKEEASWFLVHKEPTAEENDRDVCVICLEHFSNGDRLRVLPCDHKFHVGCIDRWLSGSHSFDDCYTSGCPTCKKRPVDHPLPNDGSVPSWAFARIGDALARSGGNY